jgi:hypothetical protein
MWNSKSRHGYKSLFLLVRVRSGGFRITLPLALFLIDETLEMIAGMLWLVEKFAPVRIGGEYSCCGSEWRRPKIQKFKEQGLLPHEILELCRELLDELRRHGRYSLVEAEVGEGSQRQRVVIELL